MVPLTVTTHLLQQLHQWPVQFLTPQGFPCFRQGSDTHKVACLVARVDSGEIARVVTLQLHIVITTPPRQSVWRNYANNSASFRQSRPVRPARPCHDIPLSETHRDCSFCATMRRHTCSSESINLLPPRNSLGQNGIKAERCRLFPDTISLPTHVCRYHRCSSPSRPWTAPQGRAYPPRSCLFWPSPLTGAVYWHAHRIERARQEASARAGVGCLLST